MDAPSGPSDAAVRYRPYRKVWAWLFMAWFICYLDRSITGPVVSWMIANDVGFLADVPMQHAMAGIVGSMFFAGYMLTQFPAGYLGDRYGHRTMVVISTAWAGIATLLSGLSRSLFGFVAMRVLTGLGEGAYYSNDRAIINEVTPKEEKGFAMGVVFVGLALGLTVATLVTVPIIELAVPYVGSESAWTVPFVLFSIPTMLISYGLWRRLEARKAEKGSFLKAATRLVLISAVLLVVVMATFEGTLRLGWGGLEQAAAILLTALGLVAVIYWRLKVVSAPVLRSRNLWLMYLSALPILYTLWFFGFWALLLVSESAEMGLPSAAVYASLFGVAGLIGYPLGGRLGDRAMRVGWGRRRTYVGLCLAVGGLGPGPGLGGPFRRVRCAPARNPVVRHRRALRGLADRAHDPHLRPGARGYARPGLRHVEPGGGDRGHPGPGGLRDIAGHERVLDHGHRGDRRIAAFQRRLGLHGAGRPERHGGTMIKGGQGHFEMIS